MQERRGFAQFFYIAKAVKTQTIVCSLLQLKGLGARAIIAALPSLIKSELQKQAYQIYVTDSLQTIAENTAKFAGGKVLQVRFADVLETKKKVEQKTGDEIAADVIKRAGLKVVS